MKLRLPTLDPRLRRALRWTLYPLFYICCLVLFARLTFPYERIKERTIAEFNAHQSGTHAKRLEIEEMSGHWLFGIEAQGVRMTSNRASDAGETEPEEKAPTPSVLSIDSLYASVSLLRLMFGTLSVDFGAELSDGSIDGYFLKASDKSEIEVDVSEVSVAGLAPLEEIIELPLSGVLTGRVELTMPEGKLEAADGKLELSIDNLEVGDGKAKIRNTIALPKLRAGTLKLEAEAAAGKLELKEFSTKGPDFQLSSGGSLRLRDPFNASLADLRLNFKFMDGYKNKSDITRGLFGAPDSKVPGLFDLDPKIKRAKGADGSYGWRASGQLGKMTFAPASEAGSPSTSARNRRTSRAKKTATKKPKSD